MLYSCTHMAIVDIERYVKLSTTTVIYRRRRVLIIQMLTWWSPRNELLTMDYDRQTVDDRFSVQRGYQRERNLQISNVRTADAGDYTCKLSQDTTRATVLLVVNGTRHYDQFHSIVAPSCE